MHHLACTCPIWRGGARDPMGGRGGKSPISWGSSRTLTEEEHDGNVIRPCGRGRCMLQVRVATKAGVSWVNGCAAEQWIQVYQVITCRCTLLKFGRLTIGEQLTITMTMTKTNNEQCMCTSPSVHAVTEAASPEVSPLRRLGIPY